MVRYRGSRPIVSRSTPTRRSVGDPRANIPHKNPGRLLTDGTPGGLQIGDGDAARRLIRLSLWQSEEPMAAPPPEPPPPRRPFYYPYPMTAVGCLFWVFVILLVWLIVGWLWAPLWWPWWR